MAGGVEAEQINPDIEAFPVELVPIARLTISDSPRVDGEDPEHIRTLAGTAAKLPPILVHRPTMRVIDGAHRVRAALSRNEQHIEARYVDGSGEDAFILAVKLNTVHGLPLSRADRNAAVERILRTHPHWSDRAVAAISGLSDKTVGSIRRRTTAELPPLSYRVGRDGRVRPYDAAAARLRAASLVADWPDMPVREIAELAGISVTTARDVRDRVRDGLAPVPDRQGSADGPDPEREARSRRMDESERTAPGRDLAGEYLPASLRLLRNDPSLRHNEVGRMVLRLLDTNVVIATEQDRLIDGVPTHCADAVARAASQYAEAWRHFAQQLEHRGRMMD
ncbi:MAG: streptomycin biosynthesis protein [Labedaea sp.]